MDEVVLFLLVVAVTGFFTMRWSLRLARPTSELPVKSIIAFFLAAMVGLQPFLGYQVGDLLRLFAVIAAPIWAFGPLAAVALARSRRYGLADGLTRLLYWGPEGRQAIGRLLAQVALQQADTEAAEKFAGDSDPLLALQAASLREDWPRVLTLAEEVPRVSDNAFLADQSLIRAHIGMGRMDLAQQVLDDARQRLETDPARQGPIGYRMVKLSEARIAAEYGNMVRVRELLAEMPQGTPAWIIYGIVARAAEMGHRIDEAASLYVHTYQVAPEGARQQIGEQIERLGRQVPVIARRGPALGTLILVGGLVLLYVAQELLNARVPDLFTAVGRLRPSDAVAAYMQGIPTLATADALWRHVSYAFVHGNLVHIGFNVWVLFDLGRVYEARRNWGSLLMAFVFGTVMGAYLTGIAQAGQVQLLVGASGGVLGVGGALLADSLRSGLASDRQLTRSLLQWVVLIVLFSVAIPNVSLWGHIGGLVGGLLWGFIRQGLPRGRNIDRFAGGLAAGVLVWSLVTVILQVLQLI